MPSSYYIKNKLCDHAYKSSMFSQELTWISCWLRFSNQACATGLQPSTSRSKYTIPCNAMEMKMVY